MLKALFDSNNDIRILLVGLNGAGKTTILHKLDFGEIDTTIPNIETVQHKNISITSWDSDCREIGPWKLQQYFKNAQAVIFVVNSTNRKTCKARKEMYKLLREDELRNVPILVLANFQDWGLYAMKPSKFTDGNLLGLENFPDHSYYIQATCAKTGDGLYEGLDWLASELKRK